MKPAVELRRLRMRQAAGRQFADVVIGVSPGAAVGQGHAAADAVEAAVARALPNADVVVHVEPIEDADLRERAHAAALAVPHVREVHNIALVDVDGHTELSLHAKLPGDLSLEEAHAIAERLEASICAAVPEIEGVQTHIEPLAESRTAREVVGSGEAVVRRIVHDVDRVGAASPPLPAHRRRARRLPHASASTARAGSTRPTRGRARSRSRSVARGRTSPT